MIPPIERAASRIEVPSLLVVPLYRAAVNRPSFSRTFGQNLLRSDYMQACSPSHLGSVSRVAGLLRHDDELRRVARSFAAGNCELALTDANEGKVDRH